jgi:ABC-type microcin C transport system duplicated ATPase subunit YejF
MDDVKLQNFIGKYVGDLGGAFMMAMVLIGDELGLYKAMADGQSVSADALGEVMAEAGFSQFRRATETPFNLILEARK